MTPLAIGDRAPPFTLPTPGGPVSLAGFKGRKVVLFFYPRADTPGCTREAADFSRLQADFRKAGTDVLGISADPVEAQARFDEKHDLRLPLASDLRHETLKAYGVWGKKTMFGRSFEGIKRSTVLIDRDGRIARIWRNVKVEGHARAVLEAATSL